ncbi:hypothetical protein H8F23_22825 [Pseudomonas sp. P155]|uniref:Uncharacterized protein n=1 Tax=Pseudomonas neuropathica TaxID=2730425 RepID=A0ABS0BNS1_9PSED|nr:hypothetical protein [Pseudomonas neuropathica]MBF6036094.1 hypothetical protein [Pseudomonas neuropathica]
MGIVLFFLQLHFSYLKFDRLFEFFRHSCGIQIRQHFLKKGIASRMFLTMNLGWMIFRYKRSISNGELDSRDYEAVPSGLRIYIQGMHLSALVLGVVMVVLFVIGKYMGWLK